MQMPMLRFEYGINDILSWQQLKSLVFLQIFLQFLHKYVAIRYYNMAGFIRRMFDGFKLWIAWLWTYLWALWFLLVLFVVFILRGPLRIGENVSSGKL